MNRIFTFTLAVAALAAPGSSSAQTVPGLALPGSPTQSQPTPYTQSHAIGTRLHDKAGFTDYALGKVNPTNRDYGTELSRLQSGVLAATVDDVYFWSNFMSLTLLAGVTGLFVLQLRAGEKKERVCSELIAQLWNGRVSDAVEIERRTVSHNELVDKYNALMQSPAPTEDQTRYRKPAGEGQFRENPRIEIAPAQEPLPAPVLHQQVSQTSGPAVTLHSVEPTAPPVSVSPVQLPEVTLPPEPDVAPETVRTPALMTMPAGRPKESNASETTPVHETQRLRAELDAVMQESRRYKAQTEALTMTQKNLKKRLNDQQEYISSLEKTKDQTSGKAHKETV